MSNSKALRSGIGYTLGNILIKGINFLTLPIFSRLLSPEEFGVYNIFASYDAILFVLVGLALHASLQSANLEYRGKINNYTASVTLIYIFNGAVLVLFAALFRNQLASVMGLPAGAVWLLVLGSFATAIVTLYNSRISLDYSYKKYLLVSACSSLANIGVSLVLILTAFREDRAMGRILGTVIPLFLISLVLLISLYRKARPVPNKTYWKFGLRYSLPIVPHGISQVLLGQCDRIMIGSLVNKAAAGVYALAGNIKLILVIITDSVGTAWTTWFYSRMDKGETRYIQKRATQLTGLFVILTTGLMALSPELVFLLGGKGYESGVLVAIPMVLDGFILFLYNIIVPAEYYAKKTTYIMAGTMVAAVVNVALNYVFIRHFGFVAAAYTTLAAYVLYVALHCCISRHLVKFFVLPLPQLLGSCALTAGLAVWNLCFMGSIPLRWGMCALVSIPLAILLLRQLRREKGAA